MSSSPVPPTPQAHERSPLVDFFDLEALGDDHFRAPQAPDAGETMFGGQAISQALRAATLTVDSRYTVQSLHSYFVRGGNGGAPTDLAVDRIRDGRSFATRRVVASQAGKDIFVLDASFQVEEGGVEYQVAMTPGLPGPDDAFAWTQPLGPAYFRALFEQRDFEPDEPDDDGVFRSTRRFWIRARHRLPDEPALHAVILSFVSDCATLFGADAPIGAYGHNGMRTSLDHCVWFHRPARIDEWVLLEFRPISNASARGLLIGEIHTQSGELVATAAQEVLTRP